MPSIADLTMTELVMRNSGPKPQAHCRIYMRADADIRIIEQRIQFEPSEAIKRGLKIALTQFRYELKTHQNCNCREAA